MGRTDEREPEDLRTSLVDDLDQRVDEFVDAPVDESDELDQRVDEFVAPPTQPAKAHWTDEFNGSASEPAKAHWTDEFNAPTSEPTEAHWTDEFNDPVEQDLPNLPGHLVFEAFPDAIMDSTGIVADFISGGAFSKLAGYDEAEEGESYTARILRLRAERAKRARAIGEKSLIGETAAELVTGTTEAAGNLVPLVLGTVVATPVAAASGLIRAKTAADVATKTMIGLMVARSLPENIETARSAVNEDGSPVFGAFGRALYPLIQTAMEVVPEILGAKAAQYVGTKTLETMFNNPKVLSLLDRLYGVAIDGGTEVVTTVGQNTTDFITGADPKAFEDTPKQLGTSFAIGGLLSSASHAVDAIATKVDDFIANPTPEAAADLGVPNEIAESPEGREQLIKDIEKADTILADRDAKVQEAKAELETNVAEKIVPIQGMLESLAARESSRDGTGDFAEFDKHANDVNTKMVDILQKEFPDAKVHPLSSGGSDSYYFDVSTDDNSVTIRVSNHGAVSSAYPAPDANIVVSDAPLTVLQDIQGLREKLYPEEGTPEAPTGEEVPPPEAPTEERVPPSETPAALKGIAMKNASMRAIAREFGRGEELYSPARREDRAIFEQAIAAGMPERALSVAQSLIENPRVPSDLEGAGLLLKARETVKTMLATKQRIEAADLAGDKEQAAVDQHLLEQLSKDFGVLQEGMAVAGTEWGYSGHFRQVMLALATDAVTIASRMRAATKKPLTPQQLETATALAAEGDAIIKETKAAKEQQAAEISEEFFKKVKTRESIPEEDVPEVVARIKKLLDANCDLE